MSLTPSTMVPLGTLAPDFSLPDLEGKMVSLKDFDGSKAYVIAFICVHCPYIKHLEKEFSQIAVEYKEKRIAFIGINSNDPEYDPADGLAGMVEQASRYNFTFPYLIDKTQKTAKDYQASCTPDFFVFDKDKKLVYRGQFDDTRPGMGKPTGDDLKKALDLTLDEGEGVIEDQKPSTGCSIKWANNFD
jgi:peroxiredoxin